tara:strand:- start:10611 stop:11594 length:984 start_codon:yes stop_codon:yes gene_type:complete
MESLPKRLSKILKSQAGFSLAELMVAAGVTGTLALGTMQLASLQNKAKLTDDLVSAQQAASLALKNTHSCRRTLRGLNPINASSASPVVINNGISSIHDEESGPVAKCQADGTNCVFRVSPGAADIAAGTESAITNSPNYVVFGSSVMVEQIAITNFQAIKSKGVENSAGLTRAEKNIADGVNHFESSGVVEVRFIFAVKDSTRPVNQKIRKETKYVYVPVSLSSNIIDDCNQPEDQGVLNAEFEMCETMGGSFVNGKCVQALESLVYDLRSEFCENKIFGSFNPTKGTCVPKWYGCSCPDPGDYVINFTPDNQVVCNSGSAPTCTF